jgi:hypothetical protein
MIGFLLKKISNKIYYKNKKKLGIENLINSEKSKEIYIFGDGHSLKYYDLKYFSDKPSISLGFISLHNQASSLNLKYSILGDSWSFVPIISILSSIFGRLTDALKEKNTNILRRYINPMKIIKGSFFSFKKFLFENNENLNNSNIVTHSSNLPFLKNHKINIYLNKNDVLLAKFQNNLKKLNIDPYKSGLRIGIFLSILLGVKKIYLIGCDYLSQEPSTSHWYENSKPKNHKKLIEEIEFIELVSEYIDLKIIDKIPVKEENKKRYIFYEDYVKDKKKDYSNINLMSMQKLNYINQLGFYEIFSK